MGQHLSLHSTQMQHLDASSTTPNQETCCKKKKKKKKSMESNGMEWLWKEFESPTSKLLWDWGH